MPKLETVVLKVQVHCDECIRKIKKAIADIPGVDSIVFDAKQKRFTIVGDIDVEKVLKKVKKTGKQVELLQPANNLKEFRGNFEPKDLSKMLNAINIGSKDSEAIKADFDRKKMFNDKQAGSNSNQNKDSPVSKKATSEHHGNPKEESGKKKGEPTFMKQEAGNKTHVPYNVTDGHAHKNMDLVQVKMLQSISGDQTSTHARVEPQYFGIDNHNFPREKPNLAYSYAHDDVTFMFSEDNPQSCSIM